MIVGGQTKARAQLSSTITDYHEPFDQGFSVCDTFRTLLKEALILSLSRINKNRGAVVNRALEKRGLSAKRDSPTLQQRSI